jgi:hypothetical protein
MTMGARLLYSTVAFLLNHYKSENVRMCKIHWANLLEIG